MFKKNFLQKGMIDLNVHKSSAFNCNKGFSVTVKVNSNTKCQILLKVSDSSLKNFDYT